MNSNIYRTAIAAMRKYAADTNGTLAQRLSGFYRPSVAAPVYRTPMQRAGDTAKRWQWINKGLDAAYAGAEALADLPKNIGKALSPAAAGGLLSKAFNPANVQAAKDALHGVGSGYMTGAALRAAPNFQLPWRRQRPSTPNH